MGNIYLKWKELRPSSQNQHQLSKLKHGTSVRLTKSVLNNISVNTLFYSGTHLISLSSAQLKSPNSPIKPIKSPETTDASCHKKMAAQLEFLSEPPTSSMIKVFSDTLKFKISQSEETLTRSSDLFKLSNTLMSSVRSAQQAGNQVAKLWSQTLMPLRPRNTSRDNEER